MFRFLRKYNKWILAVGGTLLLIVFLVPQAIQGLSQAAAVSNATRATIASADGSIADITDAQIRVAQRDLELMQRQGGIQIRGLGTIDDPWHWFLLTREAEAAGLVGGRYPGLDPSQVFVPGFSYGEVEDALVRIRGVQTLVALYRTAGQFSDRRLRAAADELFQGVTARLVIVEAKDDAVDLQPTASQIAAQLEAYRENAPGEDPDAPFGYRLPNRVKLEWLEIPADSVRAMIETSDALSGTELRKHWRRNAGTGGFPPVPADPPATVPDVVRDALLAELTEDKLDEITRTAASQLRSKTHGLTRQGAYLSLPDDWADQRMSMTDLAAVLQERFGIALPSYRSSGDNWLDAVDLLELDGIGTARTDRFPGRSTLADLVMVTKEFQSSPDVLIQSGVAGPSLEGSDGTVYFFRILDTDAARPPADISEVRDEVLADLRRIAHYEQLVAGLSGMESEAETDGLLPVALTYDTIIQRAQPIYPYDQSALQIQFITGQPLTPVPTTLPIIGPDGQVVRAILDYTDTLPASVEFDSLSETQKIFTVPAEHALAVVVGELIDRIPFTEALYRQRVERGEIQAVLLSEELGDSISEAFSFDALAERHQFVRLGVVDEEIDGTTQPAE